MSKRVDDAITRQFEVEGMNKYAYEIADEVKKVIPKDKKKTSWLFTAAGLATRVLTRNSKTGELIGRVCAKTAVRLREDD